MLKECKKRLKNRLVLVALEALKQAKGNGEQSRATMEAIYS